MKQEIRIEFNDNKNLDSIIKKSYFGKDNQGKIKGNKNNIELSKKHEEYANFKGLDKSVVKLLNDELIDGSFRCIVEELDNKVKLYPISIYCIVDEQDKYSFY